MSHHGVIAPAGTLSLRLVIRPGEVRFWTHALPRRGLPALVNRWRWRNLLRVTAQYAKVSAAVRIARLFGVATAHGRLSLRLVVDGELYDLGIAGYRVVTDTGVAFLVDCLHANGTVSNLKFHGFGTGTTNEAASQTGLVTELTTEYATDNTRPTGSQAEGATANVYRSVGTLDPDVDSAITEHGVFDQAANSGGTMLDRTKFPVVNVPGAGGSLEATYDFTITSGS